MIIKATANDVNYAKKVLEIGGERYSPSSLQQAKMIVDGAHFCKVCEKWIKKEDIELHKEAT